VVDERKVKLMTRLEIYEQKELHKDIALSRFYKNDYVRYNVLKSIVAATIAYWTVIGTYIFLQFEDILVKLNENLDYFDLIYKILGYYVFFCIAYFFLSTFVYYYRYEMARPGLTEYNSNLRDLIELEGGPLHRGKLANTKVVAKETVSSDAPTEKKPQSQRVNRTAVIQQKQLQAEQKREQEILENVKQRNERIAAKNEEELRKQQLAQREQIEIRERRRQLEQQQLEQYRASQATEQARQNVYNNFQNSSNQDSQTGNSEGRE